MQKGGVVYILTTASHTALYVGVTAHLLRRMLQHRGHESPGSFSDRYNCTKLVYYCAYESIQAAIAAEKKIKAGSRARKLALINSMNPEWRDLFDDILDWDWR